MVDEFDNLIVNNVLTVGAELAVDGIAGIDGQTTMTRDYDQLLIKNATTGNSAYLSYYTDDNFYIYLQHGGSTPLIAKFLNTGQLQLPVQGSSGGGLDIAGHAHFSNSTEAISKQDLADSLYERTPIGGHAGTNIDQYIRFYNPTTGISAYLFTVRTTDDNEPILYSDRGMAVYKDIAAGGRLDSMEGIVSLAGGVAGWAPSNNPFIWLVGNYYDNPDSDTLEIRTSTYDEGYDWDWGNLACGTIIIHHLSAGGYLGPLYLNMDDEISYSASSMRYKENVETAEDASWIYNLRPVNFDWKDQNRAKKEGRQIGLIAEEVYALYPQLTWLDSKGRPEGVHYEWLGVPLLVEVKKLRKRVEALENKLKQKPVAA